MYFDPLYFLFLAPAILLSLYASFRTKWAFNKYSKVRVASGMTGAQAAHRLLVMAGIRDVEIVPTHGTLSDHYNPLTKKLALSEPVYGSSSIAAVGVACHEAGHAIQHAHHYKPLWLRSALVPTAKIGSSLGWIVMVVGLMMMQGAQGGAGQTVVLAGALLFSAVLLFQIVTLPVEFDASARAKVLAVEQGIVLPQEREGIDRVLNAAALTYVAAALSTLMTLLYYLMRAGLLGGRRD
jgi:Zn-dependent membrane protease YugP